MDDTLASLIFSVMTVGVGALLVWRLAPPRSGHLVAVRARSAPARRRAGRADRVPEDRC